MPCSTELSDMTDEHNEPCEQCCENAERYAGGYNWPLIAYLNSKGHDVGPFKGKPSS